MLREKAAELQELGEEAFKKGVLAAAKMARIAKDELKGSGLTYQAAELCFGITLVGGADVKVVKGEAQALFNFTIHWGGDENA